MIVLPEIFACRFPVTVRSPITIGLSTPVVPAYVAYVADAAEPALVAYTAVCADPEVTAYNAVVMLCWNPLPAL